MNPKLPKSPSANGEFWKCFFFFCGGRLGATHFFACANVLVCFQHSETVRKTAMNVPDMKRGSGLIKSGVSRSTVALERGLRSWRRTVLYLPCEEN